MDNQLQLPALQYAFIRSVKAEVGGDRSLGYLPYSQGTASRDGKFILKYFFLRQAGRTDPRARRGSQQAKPTRTDSPGD
jgi:hypothetical protein